MEVERSPVAALPGVQEPGGGTRTVTAKGLQVDLNRAVWRKSSQSGPHCDNCVEVAFVDEAILLRDSKNPQGPVLVFTQGEWDAFVGGARDGEFDI